LNDVLASLKGTADTAIGIVDVEKLFFIDSPVIQPNGMATEAWIYFPVGLSENLLRTI
jgi:hypothetical protein